MAEPLEKLSGQQINYTSKESTDLSSAGRQHTVVIFASKQNVGLPTDYNRPFLARLLPKWTALKHF